jgi:hypothetical protein
MAKKVKVKHICESCCKEFNDKDLYWVDRINYRSLHCMKCIDNLNLKLDDPYKEPKKSKKD